MINLLQSYPLITNPYKKYVFVCDNARIHHSRALSDFRSYLNIHFMAPYSPFCNMIEEVFGLVKYYMRQMYKEELTQEQKIVHAFRQVQKSSYYGFYHHITKFIKPSLNMEDIL